MKKYWKIIAGIMMTGIVVSCLDPYALPETEKTGEYLVIEGFLNSEEGSCEVRLSRTIPLDSEEPVAREISADVKVESESGDEYTLFEIESGVYSSPEMSIDNTKKYRLRVVTRAGKQFVSEYVPIRATPPIDSISWKVNTDEPAITIYANTHDDTNATRYYQWQFTETWAYHSAYGSSVQWVGGTVYPRLPEEFIYNCWRSAASTTILTGSSAKLERDVMSEFALKSERLNSEKLGLRYSILVKQFAITKEAFEYWEALKKNTENLGTIFDPLPSQLTGNFVCVTSPDEPVIGFFQAGSMQQQRIFIQKKDLPPTRTITQYDGCSYDTILLQNLPNYTGNGLLINGVGVTLIGYTRSNSFCVDCRLAGGTTNKPDFWE